MLRQAHWLFAMLLLLPLTANAARQTDLVNPEVEVTQSLSAPQVGQAVQRALVGRRWIVTNQTTGSLEATQMSRGLMAKIRVTWDARAIRIQYLDSQGLSYEDDGGKQLIHPTYNKWIANLQKDLPVFMLRVSAGQ